MLFCTLVNAFTQPLGDLFEVFFRTVVVNVKDEFELVEKTRGVVGWGEPFIFEMHVPILFVMDSVMHCMWEIKPERKCTWFIEAHT